MKRSVIFVVFMLVLSYFAFTPIGSVYAIAPTIESCNWPGDKKDKFHLTENVYVMGSGYSPDTTYDIYVVEDVETWTDGMTIPSRVSSSRYWPLLSDSDGNIPVNCVWCHLYVVPGKYDIVVDVDGDGVYDAGTDALDDSDIQVTAGFFVIPEYPLGGILGLATSLAIFGLFKSKRLRL